MIVYSKNAKIMLIFQLIQFDNSLLNNKYHSMDQDQPKNSILFVSNLPIQTTQQQLTDHFSPYGKIDSIYINAVAETIETTQAFVEFEDMRDAFDAYEALKDIQFKGKPIKIEYRIPGVHDYPTQDDSEQFQRSGEDEEYDDYGSNYEEYDEERDDYDEGDLSNSKKGSKQKQSRRSKHSQESKQSKHSRQNRESGQSKRSRRSKQNRESQESGESRESKQSLESRRNKKGRSRRSSRTRKWIQFQNNFKNTIEALNQKIILLEQRIQKLQNK